MQGGSNMEKAVAIITARGGSKRIPRKNIKEFCGKPIILYSIEAALQSGMFDEVMVSTEDEEIAEIARQAGAKVPFMRSEKTSDDHATTADVILEVLETYRQNGKEFSYACCIYPTAPFVTAEKLKKGIELLKEKQASMVMPIVPFSFPPQRCQIMKEDGCIEMKWPENRNTRSQDLETFYHDCGQFYFYNVKDFFQVKGQITEKIYPIVMPEQEVQDIDNMSDWELAEIKYKIMKEKNK